MLANATPIREDAGMDFDAEGLLDGLEGEERKARERLLEQLVSDGVELDELKQAVAEERLALLPVERVLGGDRSASQIAAETGLPTDLILRIRRLTGLPEAGPDDPVFGAEDLEATRSIKMFLDAGLDPEAIGQVTRVLGEGMARLAATVAGGFVETFLKAGDSEEDVALRFASLAQELTPALQPVLVAVFKAHLRDAVSRGMLGRAEREAGEVAGAQDVVVCFADLVGFTRLGAELEVQDLGTVATRLGELAIEVSKTPVRLVKTIGDAAMFVSTESEPMVDAALRLVEAFEEAGLPELRAGIASGPAVQRAGDYYGPSVNLASRVTGIARPGSVLCTEPVRDAAADAFEWSFARKRKLKGINEATPLFRARRIDGGKGDSARAKTPKADRR